MAYKIVKYYFTFISSILINMNRFIYFNLVKCIYTLILP